MHNVQSILFDLDGCLTDSGPSIIHCLEYTLKELGKSVPPPASLQKYVGPPLRDNMVDLLGEAQADEGVRLFRYCFQDLGVGVRFTTAYEGIAQCLAALTAANKQLYIATSKGLDSAMMVLENLGLKKHFSGFYGGGANGIDKGELIAKVIAEQNLNPATTIMIGDRHHDIDGAKKNGLRSVGVLWGYGSRQELEEAGADALVERPEMLTKLLVSKHNISVDIT